MWIKKKKKRLYAFWCDRVQFFDIFCVCATNMMMIFASRTEQTKIFGCKKNKKERKKRNMRSRFRSCAWDLEDRNGVFLKSVSFKRIIVLIKRSKKVNFWTWRYERTLLIEINKSRKVYFGQSVSLKQWDMVYFVFRMWTCQKYAITFSVNFGSEDLKSPIFRSSVLVWAGFQFQK